MGNESKGFLLLYGFYDQIAALTDVEAGQLLKALYQYEMNQEEPLIENRIVELMFLRIRPIMDSNRERYTEACERQRQKAKSRWSKDMPRDATACTGMPSYAGVTKQKQKQKPKPNTIFIPPTMEQVKEYSIKRNRIDLAEKFFTYYAEALPPWTDKDGTEIRSWKQKFVTWESRNPAPQQNDVAQILCGIKGEG